MAYSDGGVIFRGDLTSVVEEARQADSLLIGLKVFPIYGTPLRQGRYPKWRLGKGKLLNKEATVRGPGGEYGEIKRAFEQDTYDCIDRGLEERVDDTNAADMARFFNAEATAARQVDLNFRLDHEVRIAAELMSSTNFTATNSATAYTEANLATMDFPADVLDVIARLDAKGGKANTIVLSNYVANRIKRSTRFQNFVRGNLPAGQPVMMTTSQIAQAFSEYGITQVLVGRGSYNGGKGNTFSATSIWGNTYVWVGDVQSGDPKMGGAGRTFAWTGDGGALIAESYRDDKRRSQIVRVRQHTDEKVIDGVCGGELITTQYS